jgi:hypothetical protein
VSCCLANKKADLFRHGGIALIPRLPARRMQTGHDDVLTMYDSFLEIASQEERCPAGFGHLGSEPIEQPIKKVLSHPINKKFFLACS